ncbi:hypothetical protein DFP93_102225 [Aneurinibacillus soli]|uniref:Uncharacterized protein n=1 Tax=Aneurinibacillus soli TaxID=1500254 RepID=A0A0U5BBE8_9BACL|nr:hypothetical protein [Aneurinibacillus soli]PYE63540.1 hypothetical protein DFP93_102225 [Aneurinibacillus soli]BAU27527.1 hypothetical protein CB4_01701 [Aneurinibacillus soli]
MSRQLKKRILQHFVQGRIPDSATVGVDDVEFGQAIEDLAEERLLSGVVLQRGGSGNRVLQTFLDETSITEAGEKYAQNEAE